MTYDVHIKRQFQAVVSTPNIYTPAHTTKNPIREGILGGWEDGMWKDNWWPCVEQVWLIELFLDKPCFLHYEQIETFETISYFFY